MRRSQSHSTRRARDNLGRVGFAAVAALLLGIGLGFAGGESVTIFARPTVLTTTGTTLYGSVESGRSGEDVTIQAKDCGQQDFRVVAGTTTNRGGGWSILYYPRINTTVRAVWNGEVSPQIAIKERVSMFLDKLSHGRGFRAGVGALRSFWHKRVLIQRRVSGGWKTVKSVVLTNSAATTGPESWSQAEFTLAVPKGTLVRAVMPLSQARPCYLAGASRPVRK